MIDLIEMADRECIDVKVVPDLLHVITLGARLEDLDGIPIININDVPLQGLGSLVKRAIDVAVAAAALAVLLVPFAVIAALIRWTSPGPVLYRQARMGLDRQPFVVLKFRSMYEDAERDTGPVWARANDPRRTPVGRFLAPLQPGRAAAVLERAARRHVAGRPAAGTPVPSSSGSGTACRSTCCGTRSSPDSPAGLRSTAGGGDTSIEKRIEHDLYYIEHWSVRARLQDPSG